MEVRIYVILIFGAVVHFPVPKTPVPTVPAVSRYICVCVGPVWVPSGALTSGGVNPNPEAHPRQYVLIYSYIYVYMALTYRSMCLYMVWHYSSAL